MILNDGTADSTGERRLAPVDKMVGVGTGFVGRPLALLVADHGKQVMGVDSAYKPDTNDTRNSAAVTFVDDRRADGCDIAHDDRYVEGTGYTDTVSVIGREVPDVVLQLVPHADTIAEIGELGPIPTEDDIDILQFGGGNPIGPTTNHE